MKVIKIVDKEGNKLVSTFARGKWQKEYAEGIETKPDAGYLFAYPRRNMEEAISSMGTAYTSYQYWLAEAEVVGRICSYKLSMASSFWHSFWGELKLRLRARGANYLLCSSITLIKRLA